MKNKIAYKLIKYFTLSLLLFSVIIGSLFMTFFRAYTVDMYKSDMKKRAVEISNNLSNYLSDSYNPSNGMNGSKSGKGLYYLRFLNQIDMTDVWIVDEDLNLITVGPAGSNLSPYTKLPENADALVNEAFKGNTTYSEGFSNFLDNPSLTIGNPVFSDGKVVAVLLLHSPIKGLNNAIYKGFSILGISLLIGLLISISISIALAISFTKPLNKMKLAAKTLASGDYTVKTGVHQKDEIGELAGAIDVLSEKLYLSSLESQRLEVMRRDFISNISHELRTPVTVIRGSLEALCDNVITDSNQIKEYYHQMLGESIFLQRLVNDLLDLSKLQNSDFKIEIEELNLSEILEDVVRISRQISKSKDIFINLSKDSSVLKVSGDYDRLRQMLLIILDNAIKFSPNSTEITISLKSNVLCIEDKGYGIPKDELPHIFDRFYKTNSNYNIEGTGLGLSIAKQIADRHNIAIHVESIINLGTKFTFTF